jgi:glycosyltransferase involved in cell wall biosynthesis
MEYKYTFTVCTPTYNCGKFIHRVYESLINQTFKDFEWIVIDDGSTDNTKELIEKYKQTNPELNIKYFHQENSGKPTAMNKGIELAKGILFVTMDADDRFMSNALEVLYNTYLKYLKNNDEVALICCNCITQDGKLHGTMYPKSPWISDEFEMRFSYNVKGEKWHTLKTEVAKNNLWNTEVDFHVPPTHVWYSLSTKYKTVFINDILRVWYTNQEGHESITSTKKIKYPKGRRFRDMEVINKYLDKVKQDKKFVKKTFIDYIRFSIHSKIGFSQMIKDIQKIKNKFFIILFYPLGYKKALSDRKKGRI